MFCGSCIWDDERDPGFTNCGECWSAQIRYKAGAKVEQDKLCSLCGRAIADTRVSAQCGYCLKYFHKECRNAHLINGCPSRRSQWGAVSSGAGSTSLALQRVLIFFQVLVISGTCTHSNRVRLE